MAPDNQSSDETTTVVVVVILLGGAALAIAAIVMGIIAYTRPYSGFVFFVPFITLWAAGYGTSYLLDHNAKRRRVTALVAVAAGSAAFLIALHVFAAGAPWLRNPGALLSVLGFFAAFAVVPTVGVCFGIALSCRDLRAALLGETLVDISSLPEAMIEPIRPYLDDFVRHPAWRRWSLTWLFDHEAYRRERYRISHEELQGLFNKVSELLAEQERITRQAGTVIEAQNSHAGAQAREAFLASLPEDDRGLLEAQLRVKAEAEGQVARLVKENARLKRSLAQARNEKWELEVRLEGWVLYLRNHLDTSREPSALRVMLAAGEWQLGKAGQKRSRRTKEAHDAA